MAPSSSPLYPGLSTPHHPPQMMFWVPALPQASAVSSGKHCCRHLNRPQVAVTYLYEFLGVWVWIFFFPSISSRVLEAFVLPPSPWIWQAAFKAHTSAPVT